MTDLRTDAELVAAHLAGDRSALAGMYDRYGAGLYDTAAAMLRDRHEAADAAHDVFLAAAERLSQLRDPERLKPWLFAILRNEVYRRSRRRGRALPTDFSAMGAPEVSVPHDPTAELGTESTSDLAELVRSAACGLDERDQLVLELSVRQGLQGADLAAALGVTADQSYTLVHRMRERVDRSIGALVVARAGRKDCPELAEVLRGWDGEFSVLVRKRVARHVEQCEACDRTKRKVAPLALFGAAPVFAAPTDLRDRVLDSIARGAVPPRPYRFDMTGGFPRVVRRVSRLLLAIGAGSGALLIGGAGVLVAGSGDSSPVAAGSSVSVAAPIDSDAPTSSTDSATTTSDAATTSSSSSTSTSSTTTTTAVAPGVLEVSSTVVDLAASKASATFVVRNSGGTPLVWGLQGAPAPFVLTGGGGGQLGPGAERVVTVNLTRTDLAEGDLAVAVTVTSSAGPSRTVKLVAKVVRPPLVVIVNGPIGSLPICQLTAPPWVSANWSDDSGVTATPVLSWWGPTSGQVTLTGSAGYGNAQILLSTALTGTYGYRVTVIDIHGNQGTAEGSFSVDECQITLGGASATGR